MYALFALFFFACSQFLRQNDLAFAPFKLADTLADQI